MILILSVSAYWDITAVVTLAITTNIVSTTPVATEKTALLLLSPLNLPLILLMLSTSAIAIDIASTMTRQLHAYLLTNESNPPVITILILPTTLNRSYILLLIASFYSTISIDKGDTISIRLPHIFIIDFDCSDAWTQPSLVHFADPITAPAKTPEPTNSTQNTETPTSKSIIDHAHDCDHFTKRPSEEIIFGHTPASPAPYAQNDPPPAFSLPQITVPAIDHPAYLTASYTAYHTTAEVVYSLVH